MRRTFVGLALGILFAAACSEGGVGGNGPSVDLSVQKAVARDSVLVQDTVRFTVTVRNLGPRLATDVLAGDTLPAGLVYESHTQSRGVYSPTTGVWTVGSLAVDSQAVFTLLARAQASASGQTLVNQAGVLSTTLRDSVAANNVSSASVRVYSAPPPAGVVFSSSWGTATGNGTEAVSDGGKWNAALCIGGRESVLSVVTAASVGFTRAANVLRVTSRGPTACGRVLVDNVVPASATHWGRFYWRNDDTQNTNLHPTSYPTGVGGEMIQIVPWDRSGRADGHTIGFSAPFTPGVVGVGPSVLQNGVWYRYEWQIEYLTATTFRIWPRVYSESGVLLFDASNYVSVLFPHVNTLQAYYASGGFLTITNPEWARELSIGNEGPAVSVNNGQHWYWANVAISTSGWIGQ